MSEIEDQASFGNMAIRLDYCSRKQVEEAMALLRRREIEGRPCGLGEALRETGAITAKQEERILELIAEASGRERIGGYELVNEIGRGAAGVVYRARQLALDRFVALKVIPKGPTANKEFRARFLREARIAARLSHPNIIKAIDAGESATSLYFAMELFEAPDLLKVFRKRGKLPEAEVARIGIQVADALEHARENDLVHRDVKPENILIREDTGLVKLTDLGLARSTSSDGKHLTKVGTTLGTPYYMSPEAVRGDAGIDIRTDIYSLGATMYHLAVGRPPFEADTVFQVLRMHLDAPLVPPAQVRQDLSEAFSRIVSRALRKDPAKRYQTPAEMLADLRILEADGPSARLAEDPSRTSARHRPVRRRFPVAAAAVAAACIAAVALAAVMISLRGRDDKAGKGAAGASAADPPDQGDGRRKRPAPDAGDPSPRRDPAPDAAQEAFAGAIRFAEANPGSPERIITFFEDAARKHPSIESRCRGEIERWRQRTIEAKLVALTEEVARLESDRKFGPAIRLLDAFPLSNALPEDIASMLAKRSLEIMTRAQSEARMRENRARSLAARGKFAEAIAEVEALRLMDVPTLSLKADLLEREFRTSQSRARRVAAHLDLVGRASSGGLASAARMADSGEFAAEEGPLFRRALSLLESAVDAVNRAAGREMELSKKSGGRLFLIVDSATDLRIVGRDKSGNPSELAWTEACAGMVATLAGFDAASPESALLSWCLHRDAAPLLEGAAPPAGFEKLVALVSECIASIIDSGLSEAEDSLEAGRPKNALAAASGLLDDFGGLGPAAEREGRFREIFARAKGSSLSTLAPFMFAGRSSTVDQRLEIVWDFTRRRHLRDFPVNGHCAVSAGSGRLRQTIADPADAFAGLPALWSEGSVRAVVSLPEEGGIGLRVRASDGDEAVFMAKATAGSMSAGFAKQAQDGSWQQGGKRKKTSWSRDDRAIELAFSPGKVVVGYEGSQITDRISEKGPYSLSLVFLGRCEVDEIVVSGAADPGWLESELVYEAARNKLLSGDWMDLTREMPASAWSTHGGKCAVSPGSITLDSAGALCRAWIPVSDRLVADGRDLSFRVEVKRLSDSGLFAIGFRVDGRDLAWLIRPDRDEPAPPEVPEEYALASIAPFEDGEYHVITVEFRGSEAVLYVDGALREVLGIEDIKAMEPGNLKPAGLGFSAAGGKFEVKSFSLRRNAR